MALTDPGLWFESIQQTEYPQVRDWCSKSVAAPVARATGDHIPSARSLRSDTRWHLVDALRRPDLPPKEGPERWLLPVSPPQLRERLQPRDCLEQYALGNTSRRYRQPRWVSREGHVEIDPRTYNSTRSVVTDEQWADLLGMPKLWKRVRAFAGRELRRIDPRSVATGLDKAVADGRRQEHRGEAQSARGRRPVNA